MADRRGILIPLIILSWIILSPSANRSPHAQEQSRRIDDAIASEQLSLSVLQNASWATPTRSGLSSLNLTGLEEDRGYAWDTLGLVKDKARDLLQYSLGDWGTAALEQEQDRSNPTALYTNVTGHLRGKWQRSALQGSAVVPQLNLSQYVVAGPFGQPGLPKPFQRNITGDGGTMAMRFNEEHVARSRKYENVSDNVTEMSIQLKITDSKSFDEWEFKMHGVHFPALGQAILTTTSDKLAGVFLVPQYALSARSFEWSRHLLNQSITRTIQSQIKGKSESLNPWASTVEENQEGYSPPACDVVVYLQQLPPIAQDSGSKARLSFLEHELRFPTGAILPKAPELHFSMVAFSPDCGFVIESKGPPAAPIQGGDHLIGPKIEVEFRSGRQHLLFLTATLGLQLFLLIRQMREANTPSTRSRISFYTIAGLALGDGFTTMTFLLISLFVSGLWVNLVATGFLAFINVSFFGMRFLMDIWAVQAPERARRAREQAEEDRQRAGELERTLQRLRSERAAGLGDAASTDGTARSAAQTTAAPVSTSEPRSDTLPLPVTAARSGQPSDTGATPVFMPSDQADLEPVAQPDAGNPSNAAALAEARVPSFASLYTRFYLILLAMLFVSLNASSWPAPFSRAFFTFQGMAYLSFWLPQIYRNVQRNCRHALKWEFVIGQSLLRLTPFAYFYGYSDNILLADVDYVGLAVLAVWVWIQVVLLISQSIIGPRWFWLGSAPPAFDYHPILRDDEEGATMPVGFSQAAFAASAPSTPVLEPSPSLLERRPSTMAAKDSRVKGKRVYDCAICMQELEVPVVESGAPGNDAVLGGGLLARRMYMVTPCRHIFHSACLEGWMKYRLQCPICRETLPPL